MCIRDSHILIEFPFVEAIEAALNVTGGVKLGAENGVDYTAAGKRESQQKRQQQRTALSSNRIHSDTPFLF